MTPAPGPSAPSGSGRVVAHGVDIVEIARIEAMLEAHGARFRARCFTEAEQAYADAAARRRAERYAAGSRRKRPR